jgi:MFS family permease
MSDTLAAHRWPKRARAWYALAVVTLTLTIAFVYRMILLLMIDPIKADLQITDTQIGVLHGFGTVILFLVFGFAIGRIVDVKSRRLVIALSTLVCALANAGSGLALNFWQLFLARTGVGSAEATLAPATYSLIGDYFPPTELGRALGIYSTGIYLGQGFAFVVGGWLIDVLTPHDFYYIWGLGSFRPWQMVFFCVAPMGLLATLLMWTVAEPNRIGIRLSEHKGATGKLKSIPLRDVAAYTRENWKTYTAVLAGFSLLIMFGYGAATWIPTFLLRTYELSPTEVGFKVGALTVVFGILGAFTGGQLSALLHKRGFEDANLRVALVGAIGLLPFAILYPLMPRADAAFVTLAFFLFFSAMPFGVGTAALTLITPNQMRGQMATVFQICINLISIGFGPVIIAMLTDYVFGDESDLRYSLTWSAAMVMPLTILILLWGLKPYRRTCEYFARWSE